jgi:glucose-6-phosphate 1-dehydrogenase
MAYRPALLDAQVVWQKRYQSIVESETHLHRTRTRIIKFFLHLSKKEQRKRFLQRIDEAARWLSIPVLEVWAVALSSDFSNYTAGTWGPEDTPGLLAQGHNWPLLTELVGRCRKKGQNS